MHARRRRRTLLSFFFLFLLMFSCFSNAEDANFEFRSFVSSNNVTLLGDSYLRNGVVYLTKPITSTIGALVYRNPITLFDNFTNTTDSFSTTFSFSIHTLSLPSFTNSLSFFLSPSTTNLSLCVLFNTRHNRVSFNLDPITTVDPIVDLNGGNTITAWIEYATDQTLLRLFLTYFPNPKPFDPLLSLPVDLSVYFKEPLYVGFAASGDGTTEIYHVHCWSFRAVGFIPARPKLQPHNVSDNSVTVTASFPVKSPRNRVGIRTIAVISGPLLGCLVIFSILGFIIVWKRKRGRNEKMLKFNREIVACPRAFDYRELKSATGEFHPSRIVGNGSFGTVYKAFLISSGTMAAVKRSRRCHEGKTEFLAELSIIAGLRHKNLVQLQGWCVEKGELFLVYDFMPNGSLDKMLYKESEKGKMLNWSHRFNIVFGLASVLVYLHEECEQRVIHRDIKTGNVLLDGSLNPRLGDFGLAKLMDRDKSPVSTLTAGTMGYLAPEYLQYGKATDKTDVFSYGVVVLEVACGKRPIEREGTRMVNLVDWVWGLHSKGRVIEAADKRLNGEFKEEEMKKLLLLGLSCAHPDSAGRPDMRRVLQILNNEAVPLAVPKVKPSLTFSSDLPLTIDEIVSEAEEFNTIVSEAEEFNTNQSMCEIHIHD